MPRALAATALLLALVLSVWLLASDGEAPVMHDSDGASTSAAPDAPGDGSDVPAVGLAVAGDRAIAGPALPRPYRLALRVVSTDGEPLEGVSVVGLEDVDRTKGVRQHEDRERLAAITDARGHAFIEDLAEASVTLVFRAPGWSARTEFFETSAPGEDMGPADVILERPAGRLRLEVHDEDGQPVRGARVTVRAMDGLRRDLARLVTDAGGAAAFDWSPQLNLVFDVRAPGHPAWGSWIAISSLADGMTLRLVLPRARLVAGRLRLPTGGPPPPGGTVALSVVGLAPMPADSTAWSDVPSHTAAMCRPWVEHDLDAEGRFRAWAPMGEPDRPLRLVASHPNVAADAEFDLHPRSTTADLELEWDARLPEFVVHERRVVTAEGSPVAHAHVALDYIMQRHHKRVEAATDMQGRFRWQAPAAFGPPFLVTVTDASGCRQDLPFGDADIVLRPVGALAGRVQARDGTAPREARVEIEWAGPRMAATLSRTQWSWIFAPRTVRCNTRGEFLAQGLAPGPWRVTPELRNVPRAAAGPEDAPILVGVDGVTTCPQPILVPTAGRVHGRILDASGRPVHGAGIALVIPQIKQGEGWGNSDGAGRFAVPFISRGPAHVSITGLGEDFHVPIDLPAEGDVGPLEFRLRGTPLLTIRLRGRVPPDGAPVRVEFQTDDASVSVHQVATAYDGTLRMRLPGELRDDTAYVAWARSGRLLGEAAPLPARRDGRGSLDMDMVLRLPEDEPP